MESDMSLRSCSRKRSRFNDEKDKNKNKNKTKTQTLKQDMSLRSSSTGKMLSEEENITEEKKKMKYMMMKNLISKKEVVRSQYLKRFRKKGKTCVQKPPFLGNWSCLNQKCKFKKGDRVNLTELLFSKDREFRITYIDHNRPVQAKHLEGKVIVLHFVPLVPWPEYFMRYETTILMDIYHVLQRKGGFEVVFIGVEVDSAYANSNPHALEECFEDKLSIMPWMAVPFSDIKFRTYWEKLFPLSGYLSGYSPTSFVFDHSGMLLQCNVNDLFYLYGAHAYPFTDKRMECLLREDAEARKRPSITKLLASSERTHLINNRNQRVFKYPMDSLGPGPDPILLMIGPQGKFVERYGADILTKNGISGYPFTRSRVAKLEVECIKKLNINMFWGRKTTFFKKDGSALSELAGKRIIVIVEDDCHSSNAKFWRMLRARYVQVKGTENEFEVIHICKNITTYSYGKNITTMSWLRHPSRHPPYRAGYNVCKILVRVFRKDVLGLFAFDRDGRLVRRTLFPSIERRNVDFPFGDMEEEFLKELVNRFEWKH
ncbi:putative nucleoredoxin 1 [Apium graveolens]|uniref:putative nucleoredoxin 1 n=1 Tax=Apium graveolens TaxID=4045 RepID=UPI003D79993D